jgi:hypothetical protein
MRLRALYALLLLLLQLSCLMNVAFAEDASTSSSSSVE